jgi:hypothetical protein
MPRATATQAARTERRVLGTFYLVAALIGLVALFALASAMLAPDEPSRFDASLPNPMGGLARTAPGEATGEASFGGLAIAGTEVAMGDIALGITYVPAWQVDNPTGQDITVTVGQPQVLEGCCPGPVYADGELTQAGQQLWVPAGGSVLLQFPLQMHAGMDGPHHLAIPLRAAGADAAVHVTGNFTPNAAA